MDDWSYCEIARILSEEGRLDMTDWPSMSLIFQVFCGSILIKIFGMKYSILHIFSYIMGFCSVLTLYYLLIEFKIKRKVSLLCSLILLVNPIFLSLSYTFMTDIFFLALVLISIFCYIKGLKNVFNVKLNKGEKSYYKIFIIALTLSILSSLVRQIGILISMSAGITLLLCCFKIFDCENKFKEKRSDFFKLSLLILLLPIILIFIFQYWMALQFGVSGSLGEKIDFIRNNWNLGLLPYRTYAIFSYLGIFLFPLVIISISDFLKFQTKQKENHKNFLKKNSLLVTSVLVFVVLFIIYSFTTPQKSPFFSSDKISSLFPYFENMISNFSTGPLTLRDTYILHYPPPFEIPSFFILIISIVGSLSGSWLFYLLLKKIISYIKNYKKSEFIHWYNISQFFILLVSGFYILQLYFYNKAFDRYIIFLIPLFSILLFSNNSGYMKEGFKNSFKAKRQYFIAQILIFLFLIISVTGLHDYISWNKGRWNAVDYLFAKGIKPEVIDGGFEFNGLFTYNSARTYEKEREDLSWWWVVDDEYIIAFNKLPNYSVHKKFSYTTFLPPGKKNILLIKRK